jgi:hypothetical protein
VEDVEMDQIRFPRSALAALISAATLTAGCAAAPQPVTAPASNAAAPTVSAQANPAVPPPPAVPNGGHGGRGGSGNRSSAAGGGMPADWPPDLPVPQGSLIGSTGSAGRWTVQLVAAGSAQEVRRSTVAFYSAAGFTAVTDSVLNRGNRQITLVVENRDHSATQTNLLIGVTTR